MRCTILSLAIGLVGAGGCFPTAPSTDPADYGGYVGAQTVTIVTPSNNRRVPTGTAVPIEYYTFNDLDREVTLRIVVDGRPSLVVTPVAEGLSVPSGRQDGTVTWDTSAAVPEVFIIRAQLLAAGQVVFETTAAGQISINGPPTLAFTAPTSSTSFDNVNPVPISWRGADPEGDGTARIGLDPDNNRTNNNEIFIETADLPQEEAETAFDWDGTDESGTAVPTGFYQLFALLDDDTNAVEIVNSGITIEVEP